MMQITDFDTSKIVTNKAQQLRTCIGTTSFMVCKRQGEGEREKEKEREEKEGDGEGEEEIGEEEK